MQVHLLLTPEIREAMPESVNVLMTFGEINVVFPNNEDGAFDAKTFITGENAIVEAEEHHIINWLRPFDGIVVGVGSPTREEFEIMHIKN